MAVIVNGDGILTGVSSLTTALDDITSGRGTITGVTTVGTLQLGTGVSISSPRSQQAAIFTNNTEFLTVDDAGRVGIAITNPTTKFDVNGTSKFQDDVTFTGASANITFDKSTDDLIFDDNAQAKFGTGGDLSIFHNGTHSFIQETGAGALQIRGANLILDNADGSKRYIDCNDGGSVELYYNNSKKFETSSIGWKSEDSVKGIFGTDGDFQIFHNGSHSFVKKISSGTGNLYLDSEGSGDLYLRAGDGSSGTNISMRCTSNAGVDLRYQGTTQCETSANGLAFPNGKGIDFSATGDGSGTDSSELFDDYEEGTWIPTLTNGFNYTTYDATYTKIGNVVNIYLYLYRDDNGTYSSNLQVTNFPYAMDSNYISSNGLGLASSYAGNTNRKTGIINSSNTTYVNVIKSGTTQNVSYDNFVDHNRSVIMKWWYYAA